MSNVLIGIIGVILFIGLALAGALFLGPRFQESTNNSRASAAVQAVSQVSSAINMYNVQEGRTYGTDTTGEGLVTDGYLKSVPSNPTGTGAIALDDASANPRYVTMPLGGNAEQICAAIVKQTQGSAAVPTIGKPGTAGCSVDSDTAPTVFTAYSRV